MHSPRTRTHWNLLSPSSRWWRQLLTAVAYFTAAIVCLTAASFAQAQLKSADFVAARDASSVDEAVAIIKQKLGQHGYSIPLVVNHQGAAKSVGLELRPTQVIYARPPSWVENRLVGESLSLAIDLPAKILVFQDAQGKINIRSNSIGYLIDRHNVYTKWPLEFLDEKNDAIARTDTGLRWVSSTLSVDAAYNAIKNTIMSLGVFRIPLELDFSSGTNKSTAKLIVFGNPNAGTPLMQANQAIALDLPQEMLVTRTLKGKTVIIYNDPFFIANRVGLQGQDDRLNAISAALRRIAQSGSGS